jgi:hypothetical protein
MALVETTLKTNLLNLFNAMKEEPMSEADYAANLAKIINDHIKTAAVTVSTPSGPGTGSLS